MKWFLISLSVIGLSVWLFISYDSRHFLTYGALRIHREPTSLAILENRSYGMADFRTEYYVSVDAREFNQLLTGRKYNLTPDARKYFIGIATGPQRYKFPAAYCYTSGDLTNGLVNVFANKDYSRVYIVYDIK